MNKKDFRYLINDPFALIFYGGVAVLIGAVAVGAWWLLV